MKHFTILIALVFFNFSFAQLKKINNYNLGILFEKVKTTDYDMFRANCKSYVGQSMFEYVIKYLDDDEMNNNTLKRQIRIRTLAYGYQEYLDKIINNYESGLNYFINDREQCSQSKFVFFKNNLTAYEMVSKYYVELYNNEIERLNVLKEFDDKYSLDSLNIVESQQKLNFDRISKIEVEKENLEFEVGLKAKKDKYENEISTLTANLESNLDKLENDKILQVKKLSPTNFQVNKAKIINNFNTKKNSIRQKSESEKNVLTINYQNSIKIIETKYYSQLEKLNIESDELKNFNYESIIPNKPDIDDSKFRENRNLLQSNLDREWKALVKKITLEIYKPEPSLK